MKHLDKQRLDILIENEVKQLTQKQIDWLNTCCNEKSKETGKRGCWKYENGVVNVNGNFNINDISPNKSNFTSLPIQFGKITGDCWFNSNELTSLKNSPYEVGGDFACNHNQLTSLEYMPKKIGGLFFCYNNPFQLNDKLFEDLAKIGRRKIRYFDTLFQQLKEQVPIQFGVTDQEILDDIWGSYMRIFNGEK